MWKLEKKNEAVPVCIAAFFFPTCSWQRAISLVELSCHCHCDTTERKMSKQKYEQQQTTTPYSPHRLQIWCSFSHFCRHSPCRHTDSEHQERTSESGRWCCHAWMVRRDPSDPPCLWAGLAPALGTGPLSWWPSPPATTNQLNAPVPQIVMMPAEDKDEQLHRLYLHCGEFAGCLLTAPSGGDADALCTQALWVWSCECCAVAAAAVHWLCLPTPAKHTLVNTHAGGKKKYIFYMAWQHGVTSQMQLPLAHPSSVASAAPALHPVPPDGWWWWWWWWCCVTAECIQCPVMSQSK